MSIENIKIPYKSRWECSLQEMLSQSEGKGISLCLTDFIVDESGWLREREESWACIIALEIPVLRWHPVQKAQPGMGGKMKPVWGSKQNPPSGIEIFLKIASWFPPNCLLLLFEDCPLTRYASHVLSHSEVNWAICKSDLAISYLIDLCVSISSEKYCYSEFPTSEEESEALLYISCLSIGKHCLNISGMHKPDQDMGSIISAIRSSISYFSCLNKERDMSLCIPSADCLLTPS